MKRTKAKIIKFGILAAVLIILVVCFGPKPLIRNVEDSSIISVMYRADEWENLGYCYPSQAVPSIDEGKLLQILNQSKAVVEVFPPAIDGIPTGSTTIQIFAQDGDQSKIIILGDPTWNKVLMQDYPSYLIIDSASVLDRVLDFLQNDENIDLSKLQPMGER